MNIAQVLRILAALIMIIAFFMLMPAIAALLLGETDMLPYFVGPSIAVFVFSLIVLFFTRKLDSSYISTRDGILLVSLSWLSASLIGSVPFFISGSIPSFTDAFFETMSGFSTTGASILTDIEAMPRSMLFWRSLTHWLGGMGIVVLTVAILPLLGIGGLQMIKAEAPGPSVDKITPKITETAKILWIIYLLMTVLETALLMLGGMNLYDALTHTFGTLATGGFSVKNSSVGHYNSAYIDGVITVFMVFAGINFTLYFKLVSGRISSVLKDTELKVYLAVFITAAALVSLNLYFQNGMNAGESIRYAAFQSASILTTTGYATADYAAWPAVSRTVIFILMFVGGCSGSTGGGIKVVRIIALFKQSINEMKYLVHPRGVFTIRINKSVVKKDILYGISAFVFLYFLLLMLATLVVASTGSGILTSFTTALACLGNIGPGFGQVGPAMNYAFYPDYVKWFLSFIMMIGRLEVDTVLILFTTVFWRR